MLRLLRDKADAFRQRESGCCSYASPTANTRNAASACGHEARPS
jgi:hypothetical protein